MSTFGNHSSDAPSTGDYPKIFFASFILRSTDMPEKESLLKEAAILIENADKFTKDNRRFADTDTLKKLFQIADFQNQALKKLRLAIETKDTK